MLLLDLTHTSHSHSQTGIQQVCRNLFQELHRQGKAEACVWDKFALKWRLAEEEEIQMLDQERMRRTPSKSSWSLAQKSRGYANRFRNNSAFSQFPKNYLGIVAPELFNPDAERMTALHTLRNQLQAPLCAVFHDAIVLNNPQFANQATLERFPAYIKALSMFDAVAPVSQASAHELIHCWEEYKLHVNADIQTIPLGTATHSAKSPRPPENPPPMLLCVSSLEPRKNHLSLFEAAESLWIQGHTFQIELIGNALSGASEPILEHIDRLKERGHPIRWRENVSQETLDAAYQQAIFTVYPSHLEGFGLPVLESLAWGKPCITGKCGGLSEFVNDGGCHVLESLDATSLTASIHKLLTDSDYRTTLTQAAHKREIRTWKNYAEDIYHWAENVHRQTFGEA